MKLLIMGLPGAGKTTLAEWLAPLLPAVWFDGDVTRKLWPELGFSRADRIEQAHRMGRLCDLLNQQGFDTIASFVCPTRAARNAFGATHTIWVDRIQRGRYQDTNEMFEPPLNADLRLVSGTVQQWVDKVHGLLRAKAA